MKITTKSILSLLLVLSALAGCVCAEPKRADDIAQIIVKFKDAATAPASAALLANIAETAQLKVRHVRPMSGGAQIYVLSGVADDNALQQAMQRLAARPDIEYAEIDRKLMPQKGQSK